MVAQSFVIGSILLFFGYFWKAMWDEKKSRKMKDGRRS